MILTRGFIYLEGHLFITNLLPVRNYDLYWWTLTTECLIHHHQFLLLFVEHRASMKTFQALRSPAIPLASFHDLPVLLISSSIVLRHVLFGLPLFLYPWGFQFNVGFSISPASLRNVCPNQFNFLLFVWISIGFCLIIFHSSSFVLLSVHFIFIIRLKHLYINLIFYACLNLPRSK